MKKVIAVCFILVVFSGKQLFALSDGSSAQRLVINFDYNIYTLNTDAKHRLDSVFYVIKVRNYLVKHVEIYGHCDSIGSNNYNDALSEKRVQTVQSYFIAHGINGPLISIAKGYGKRRPLNDNADSLRRSYNRRVEIVIQMEAPAKVETLKEKAAAPLADTSGLETIDLSHAKANDIIQLQDINFFPDRHMVVDASMKPLKVLLNTMLVNKTLRIEIRGHVCCLPDYEGDAFDEDTYKEDLSLEQAREIYLYLKENGVAADRMIYIGLGAKYPLVKEFTEQDKARNRRVEIRILSK